MEDVSDYRDIKIKELEDTIKVLMKKLEVCEDDGQVNGIDNNEDDDIQEEEDE